MPGHLVYIVKSGKAKGLLTGFEPSGAYLASRYWRESGMLSAAGKCGWTSPNPMDTERLIQKNISAHTEAGMEPYERMFDDYNLWERDWVILGNGRSLRDETFEGIGPDTVVVGINRAAKLGRVGILFVMDRNLVGHGDDRVPWWHTTSQGLILVASPMADSELLKSAWRGRYYFTHPSVDDGRPELKRIGWLEGNRIAMTSAMDMATRAKARKIVLAGADCATTDEGYVYFDDEKPWKDHPYARQALRVEGIGGKPCWVGPQMWGTAQTLEVVSHVIYEETGTPVINASNFGVLGLGVEFPRKAAGIAEALGNPVEAIGVN